MEPTGIIGTSSGSASLDDAPHVLPPLDAFAGRKWRSPGFEHGQGFSLDTLLGSVPLARSCGLAIKKVLCCQGKLNGCLNVTA